jgi:hypothetical protein
MVYPRGPGGWNSGGGLRFLANTGGQSEARGQEPPITGQPASADPSAKRSMPDPIGARSASGRRPLLGRSDVPRRAATLAP